jgi:hypothetical protein
LKPCSKYGYGRTFCRTPYKPNATTKPNPATIEDATEDATEDAIEDAIEDATEDATEDVTEDATVKKSVVHRPGTLKGLCLTHPQV